MRLDVEALLLQQLVVPQQMSNELSLGRPRGIGATGVIGSLALALGGLVAAGYSYRGTATFAFGSGGGGSSLGFRLGFVTTSVAKLLRICAHRSLNNGCGGVKDLALLVAGRGRCR